MNYLNRKFVIILSDEVSSVDFSLVLETSANTLRYNNDNTKTFVKFNQDATPSFQMVKLNTDMKSLQKF